jgi:hypothetical protein
LEAEVRRRWLLFIVIGLFFGVIDWYYLDGLSSFFSDFGSSSNMNNAAPVVQLLGIAMIIILNWGFWLVPVIPAAIYESEHSKSIGLAALSAITVWSFAILSYYGYYTILLLFWGLPNLDFMLFSNRNSPTYWQDWQPIFQRLILNQFFEWIVVALIGGAVVGALTGFVHRYLLKRKSKLAIIQG